MKSKIADILKKSRKECNLSPEYVVNELKSNGINIAEKTLYGYEAGRNNPNADTFLCLCKIYNISSFDIFFDENTNVKKKTLYDNLNSSGKVKADEYIKDLYGNPKYTQKTKSANNSTSDFDAAPVFNTSNTKNKAVKS